MFSPALRERLRRLGKSYYSKHDKLPLTPSSLNIPDDASTSSKVVQVCQRGSDEDRVAIPGKKPRIERALEANDYLLRTSSREVVAPAPKVDAQISTFDGSTKERLDAKRELLRQLRLADYYCGQNKVEELQGLVEKWTAAAQQVAEELLHCLPGSQPSMTDFLDSMNIDFRLIRYNAESESFY
ncbi:unnamed protein product [Soboliphyme baturini]|uniref:Swi5-dependent recombination DNA repair protein 1 homolog n=1 Tax=Soboliphyme baturini TaxID=241478 RepID=A0A183IKY6_9BILA|nr:unnamed protein product [Soboliphyme baturini]